MLVEMLLFAALVLMCALGLVFRARRRNRRALPVIACVHQTCANCRFFSLDGGQAIMRSHAPFFAAAQHLPPWQMGRPQDVERNPAYDALEAEMIQAGKDGDYDRQRELHNQLLETNPGELLPPTQIDGTLLELQWQDFGACGVHQEIRAQSDACDRWEPKNVT
jgi:hypothetical protein